MDSFNDHPVSELVSPKGSASSATCLIQSDDVVLGPTTSTETSAGGFALKENASYKMCRSYLSL
jgi:hypothetical protein